MSSHQQKLNERPPGAVPVLRVPLAADAQRKALHRVLVVHHETASHRALENSMRGRFEVRHARDAEDGWQALLMDQSIRAIVASVPVLEIDGYGLLQRIRRSKVQRISGIPVIVVADESDSSLGSLVTSFGASEFTPFSDLDGLRDRLVALLEPGAVVRSAAPESVVDAISTRLFSLGELTPDNSPPPPPPKPRPEIPMARLENLNKVLKTLQGSSPGVEASALISYDGLMIASALAQDMDETRIAAMTATLLNLGTRAATELRRGEVAEVIVRGEQGYAVMISAGRGALLLVLATEATPLGLIFFDMREAIKNIKTIL
jgi:predicted regulator of Ras-like GTPase activity (Roadblock/LC7/MglB family)/CheY-like chemotaxis protein